MAKTKFTQGEAAKATGYAKSKISADMKAGKFSYDRQEPGGPVQIDASELIRFYGDRFRPERLETSHDGVHENGIENGSERSRTHGSVSQNGDLEGELRFLREKLRLIETMHDSQVSQLNARISDMRSMLDDAHEQRDKAMTMLTDQIAVTKQLTDQRERETAIPMPPPGDAHPTAGRRGFLGLFGRRAG